MPKQRFFLLLICIVSAFHATAQTFHGTVTDTSGNPLAFATIKLGDTKQGLMADLQGKFKVKMNETFSFITVSHLGYKTQKVDLHNRNNENDIAIALEPSPANLEEVVIKGTASKLKRILNTALANRNRNNPDKYDWYQCNIYYKTVVDGGPDSTYKQDSAGKKFMEEFKASQHFFITETFSRRTWERPQKLQEEVLGSRISGFKKAWFSALVTNVLPFHAYNDFLPFNGKDYHNPLSNGLFQRFNFRLDDEILQGKDTIWQISFTPKKNTDQLSGSLFISSNLFAITNLKASHYDNELRREVGVEQQYSFENDRWFPQQLNYFIRWERIMNQPVELSMTGTSLIDSVTFEKNEKFRFDKAHTTKLVPGADELSDTAWRSLRPEPLTKKENRTYEVVDSIGKAAKLDKLPDLVEKLAEGYLPAGRIDIDLQKIYSYNKYEKHRLGFGIRTSNKLSKRFSVGGWFGYGTGDRKWKYGGWTEVYADKYKEFVLRLGYKNDLQDPGRLQIHPELDKNFLRKFLLGRVDKTESWSFEVNKRLGYWQAGIGFTYEKITPQYAYALNHSGKSWNSFEVKELALNLRYAYAERMSPMLGKYYSAGSKYPILYSKIRLGEVKNDHNQYIHAVAALKWQKHINRWGNEQFLLMGGAVISKKPLSLGKLFAGNGFQLDDKAFYVFGGMQTMLPYQYYSDRFINFYWNHDFDFRFYKLKITRTFSSAPSLGIGYNVLWGKLKDQSAHQFVQFAVPDPAYHEAGMMLNKLLRMKFMGLYYLDLNAGYFYHLKGEFNHRENGRFVFGLGVEL
jgi:hypothetical protein